MATLKMIKILLFDAKSSFLIFFLVIKEKGFVRKLWLISKFVKSKTVKQIIAIHTWHNILRRKGNYNPGRNILKL